MHRIMPMYLVVNTSRSMAGRLTEVTHVLDALADELGESPILADKIRVCLVSFAEHARCLLPLSDLTEQPVIPPLPVGRETRFEPLFRLLARLTSGDAAAHLAAGFAFYRPLVVLVTDGVPADRGWQAAFDQFYRQAHPRIILITVGVERAQLRDIVGPMRVAEVRVLDDSPDQPLARQIMTDLMLYAELLVTSRAVDREEIDWTASPEDFA
ncbi:hypothetical protein VA596_31765 [Amycolatopsis sp., V23-08]|uniref:VWFA domain-containing protein n=1 Tax=Amycolatopsis heterodermiae TaxID=3110235 RepID=A0ABU5RF13_9PSEU|nr:hypothetical protein [Amycolatopsis sp., V23-08]MEA5364149.1 hypothetical protein [Amycolatopsis sp., V23-08]